MVFGLISLGFPSLSALVSLINRKVSRQALHKWYSEEAVVFFQKVFSYICKIRIKEVLKDTYLNQFSSILICDSTWWEVTRSPELKEFFKKFGGKYSRSSQCKVQLVLNYLTGAIEDFLITKSTSNDPSFHENLLTMLKEKALLIVDLGYFSLDFFSKIDKKKAFFLSRLKFGIEINHLKTRSRLNLLKIAKESKENQFEFRALLGREKLEARIIGIKAPKEVAKKRREKYRDVSKRKKRKFDPRHLEQLGWSFFITNVPEKKLPGNHVVLLYSIRWQIELMIKTLKSILNIDFTMVRKNVNRIKCEIYGRLILAAFLTRIHSKLNETLWEELEVELSLDKMVKYFKDRAILVTQLLFKNIGKAIKCFYEILKAGLPSCLKESQKTRMTPREKILKIPLKHFTGLTQEYLASLS